MRASPSRLETMPRLIWIAASSRVPLRTDEAASRRRVFACRWSPPCDQDGAEIGKRADPLARAVRQEVCRLFEVPHGRRKVSELSLHAPEGPQRFPLDLRDRHPSGLANRFCQDRPRVLIGCESICDPSELDVCPKPFRGRPGFRNALEDHPRIRELSEEHLRLCEEGVKPRVLRNAEQRGLQISRASALRERRSDVDQPGHRSLEVPGLDPMVCLFEVVLSDRPV